MSLKARRDRPALIAPFDFRSLRNRFKGAYIANNGYDFETPANKVCRRTKRT